MRYYVLICVLLLSGITYFCCDAVAADSTLRLEIDRSGKVAAFAAIDLDAARKLNNKAAVPTATIWYLALPFGLGSIPAISGPSDLTISVLKNSEDYSMIAVLAPATVTNFIIKIQNVPVLRETAEGQGKISLDASFSFMSQAEKAILDASYTIADFNLVVTFPAKYEEDQVNFRPFDFRRNETARSYEMPAAAYTKVRRSPSRQDLWIVFPSPIKSSIDVFKIAVSLLAGFATIGLGWPSLRQSLKKEHRRRWYIAAALSISAVGAIGYFSEISPRGIDLLGWGAGLVPPSICAIIGAVYLFFAQRYLATIRGQVLVEGKVTKYVDVSLSRLYGSQWKPIGEKDQVGDAGEYEFDCWLRKTDAKFKLTAKYSGRANLEKSSDMVTVRPGQTERVPTLELT